MSLVQYVDRNVGPQSYKHLNSNELLVTKIFCTIQGEGPFAGVRSVFVRLAGCDKGDKTSCPWCDTDFRIDNGKVMKFHEIQTEIEQSVCFYPKSLDKLLVVITGGEPTLQDNLSGFIDYLFHLGYRIQIESNGDRLPKDFIHGQSYLVVSPKVNPSTQHYPLLKREVFNTCYSLKIVVDSDRTSPYHFLPTYLWEWCNSRNSFEKVYISPLTIYKREVRENEVASLWGSELIDKEHTRDNYSYAAHLCLQYGYTFSCQKHLLMELE